MLPQLHRSRDNPEGAASYCSKLFFCWLLPLIKASTRKILSIEDMYQPSAYDLAEPLGNKLEYHWEMEKLISRENRREPSLSKAVQSTFRWSYIYLGTLIFIHVVILRTLMVLVIWDFLYYKNNFLKISHGWGGLIVVLVLLSSLCNILFWHHNSLGCFRIGYRCRVACSSLIYRKLLKLSVNSIYSTQLDDVMHLLTVQVLKFERFSMYFHYLWVFPCQLATLATVMYIVAGYIPVIISVGICLLVLALYFMFAGIVLKYDHKYEEYNLERNAILLDCLKNIKQIKMYACEPLFENVMKKIRKKELHAIGMKLYMFAIGCIFFFGLSNIAFLSILFTMEFFKEKVPADKIYVILQCLTTLELFITSRLPYAIETLIETKDAIKRIQHFIELPEKLHISEAPPRGKKTGYVHINDCTASWWFEDNTSYTLTDINLEFKPGCLYLIIGDRLSGKSSFLQLVLNEIPLIKGKVLKIGSISYTSQDPWIFKATIRQNIIFGEQLFGDHYKQVIKVCGIMADLKTYPFGDKTVVNEHIMLDDGQKARINLARSVYRDADIYIFDEPFRNIEPGLSRHLFEQCMVGHLGEKTRIMATQHEGFLDRADFIVILRKGRIVSVSAYNELPLDLLPKLYPIEEKRGSETSSQITLGSHAESEYGEENVDHGFLQSEIRFGLYFSYFTMFIPRVFLILYFILAVISLAGFPLTNTWLMYSIASTEKYPYYNVVNTNTYVFIIPRLKLESKPLEMDKMQLFIYYSMALFSITFFVLHVLFFIKMRMYSSRKFHEVAFRNVVRSPMHFFRGNPQVAITNRFLKDTYGVDKLIPKELFITMLSSCFVIASLSTVSVLYPLSSIIWVCLGVGIYFIRKVYIGVSDVMIHLESRARLGLWAHIAATFQGITTIRCYKAEYLTTKEFDQLQDAGTPPIVTEMLLDKMLGFYVDVIIVILLGAVIVQAIFSLTYNKLMHSSAITGFVLCETIYLIGNLQFGLKASIKVVSDMYSVQKLLHYINLEPEFTLDETIDEKILKDWPDTGSIEFKRIYQIYSIGEGDELYNFNLIVSPREKVALVGHAHSGVTAVATVLFNVDKALGEIIIDNVNIDNISVHLLRRKLSIIPKDPLLIPDSIRNNIDIRSEHSDQEIWDALEKIGMKNFTDLNVDVRTLNLSYDDVLLITWARALLTNKKILVIEDSPVECNTRMNNRLMAIMTNYFKDKTILMVTNKLCMIEKCDSVVIFDQGKILTQDSAKRLIADTGGLLYDYIERVDSTPIRRMSRSYRQSSGKRTPNNLSTEATS